MPFTPYQPTTAKSKFTPYSKGAVSSVANPPEQGGEDAPVFNQKVLPGKVLNALTSSTQTFGKTAGQALAAPKNAELYDESLQHHTEIKNNLQELIDKKKKLGQDTSRLENALKDIVGSTPRLEDFTGDVINKSAGKILGEAGGTVLEAVSGGLLKGVKGIGLAEKAIQKTPEEIAAAKSAFKALPFGKKVSQIASKTAKSIKNILPFGYSADVSSKLQEGKTGKEAFTPGIGTAVSLIAPPVIGGMEVAKEASNKIGPKLINSLIKPLLKDFSYGKNPGRTVAKMGIVANSPEELVQKISDSRQKVGQEIGSLNSKLEGKSPVGLDDIMTPLDNALSEANQAPRTNASLISRLEAVKADITEKMKRYGKSFGFQHAFDLKKFVGDITKWTGNASDDQSVNKALKRMYGQIKEAINTTAEKVDPENAKKLKDLNEKYADLTSAEIAAKYRDKITQRQDIISLKGHIGAVGAALTTLTATGGAALPAILAGATGAVLDKAMGSTAVKTRVAAWLSKETPSSLDKYFAQNPNLKNSLLKVFAQDAALSKKLNGKSSLDSVQ